MGDVSVGGGGGSPNVPLDLSDLMTGTGSGEGGTTGKQAGVPGGTNPAKPLDTQDGDVGIHKNAALLDQVVNQSEDFKTLVEKFAKGGKSSVDETADDTTVATEEDQDTTQTGQVPGQPNTLMTDTLNAAASELLSAIDSISTKIQSMSSEGLSQVDFINSDEFTKSFDEFQAKLVDIPQKVLDNLTMGAPVIGPPVGGSVIDAKMTGGRSINQFLGGNPMVAFLTAYMDMINMLKNIQRAELGVTIAGLNNTMELAQNAASAIKSSAEAEAAMHFGMAAIAAAQLAVTVGTAAMQVKSITSAAKAVDQNIISRQQSIAQDKMLIGEPVGPNAQGQVGPIPSQRYQPNPAFDSNKPPSNDPASPNYRYLKNDGSGKGTNNVAEANKENYTPTPKEIDDAKKRIGQNESELTKAQGSRKLDILQASRSEMEKWQLISQMGQQGGEIFSNALQGVMKLEKAKYDALLQLIQGYQQIQRTMLDKSSESSKQAIEQVSQLCQSLVKMSDQLYKAFGFSTR